MHILIFFHISYIKDTFQFTLFFYNMLEIILSFSEVVSHSLSYHFSIPTFECTRFD